MSTISKQNATIITVVLAVLFGCTAILSCLSALLAIPGFVNYLSGYGGFSAATISGLFNILGGICAAMAFIALPVVFYFLLLYKRTDGETPGV